jgi:hypothetical protein
MSVATSPCLAQSIYQHNPVWMVLLPNSRLLFSAASVVTDRITVNPPFLLSNIYRIYSRISHIPPLFLGHIPYFSKTKLGFRDHLDVCVSVCVSPTITARQQVGKHVHAATNRTFVGRIVFYAVHVPSKESLCVCMSILLSLLGNGLLNAFPQQGIHTQQ